MKRLAVIIVAALALLPLAASAQHQTNDAPEAAPVTLTLEQALQIALDENVSVKVADMEIERTGYAKKGDRKSVV